MIRKAYPKADALFRKQEHDMGSTSLDHFARPRFRRHPRPGYITSVAPVALWPQYPCFFLASEPWLNLHGEPHLLQGYDVAEFYWKATHLRGTI